MLGLIQRVSHAEVAVAGEIVGAIDQGILLFLGVQPNDSSASVERLVNKVLNYRIFSDPSSHPEGPMVASVLDIQGALLVVSQFTLAADTKKGLRPSFSSAAPPAQANELYEEFLASAAKQIRVQQGVFGADMKVSLTNDGPVTFMLSVS